MMAKKSSCTKKVRLVQFGAVKLIKKCPQKLKKKLSEHFIPGVKNILGGNALDPQCNDGVEQGGAYFPEDPFKF